MGISQLSDQIQAKRASLQDPGFRPDPLFEDWFRAPIVEFVQRHSSKSTSSSRVITFQVHPMSRGMPWGLGILTRQTATNTWQVLKKIINIIAGRRGSNDRSS